MTAGIVSCIQKDRRNILILTTIPSFAKRSDRSNSGQRANEVVSLRSLGRFWLTLHSTHLFFRPRSSARTLHDAETSIWRQNGIERRLEEWDHANDDPETTKFARRLHDPSLTHVHERKWWVLHLQSNDILLATMSDV